MTEKKMRPVKTRMSGIADEGAKTIEQQLAIHRDFGWGSIELRTVDGTNVCSMSDEAFEPVRDAVVAAGFRVPAFGSAIANWSRPVDGDFALDRDELLRAVPRMHALGTRYIRIMSYTRGNAPEDEWANEAIRRVKELTRIARGEGVVLVHENCDGWASQTPQNLARLLGEIDDPALQIVFDPGNPVAHGLPPETVIEFFRVARERIVHFHIKDCYREKDGTIVHCYPGDGKCAVGRLIRDLEDTGYTGEYSIEPHMTVQIHKTMDGNDTEMQRVYREYCRRAERLVTDVLGRI
jgi:sugar phosphate isomerase/epimerase